MTLTDLRLFFLCLCFGLPIHDTNGRQAVQEKRPAESKIYNDSAVYYFNIGQIKKARSWVDKALTLAKVVTDKESARTYLISGDVNEEDGFAAQALAAYRQSWKLASEFSVNTLQALAGIGIANTKIALGQYDSVSFYLEKSLSLDASIRNRAMNNLSWARYWQSQNQLDKALAFSQKVYDDAQHLGDKKLMALALSGMAIVYFSQEPDMKRSLEHLQKAIALCDSAKHANIVSRNYARMANAYMVLGKTADAERYLTRAENITGISGNRPVRGYVLSSWAILKAEQNDIHTAVAYAEEPLHIKRQLGQMRQLQNDLLNITEWYITLKRYDQANRTLNEGIATSKSLNDAVYLQYFYNLASQLDSIKGNYRDAYTNLKRSMIYKDSVQSVKRTKAIEEIREKYEAEQKEKTIAEKELVIQRQKYQQSITIGVSVIAILIFMVIIIIIRNRHKIRMQLEKQRRDHVRLQTIVHTQEEVQQSIARDIHDGLVQVLGAAKMSLQAIHIDGDKDLIFHRIKEASRIMDEACTEARNIAHQLLPYSLMKAGFAPAIEELLRKSLRHSEPYLEYVYEYMQNGNVSRIIENNYGDGSTADVTLTYSYTDRLILASYSRSNGTSFQYEFFYKLRNITTDETRRLGQVCSTGEYTYDKNINPFKHLGYVDFTLLNFSVNNRLTEHVEYKACAFPELVAEYYQYEYDAQGYPNVATTFFKSANKQLRSENRYFYK